MRTSSRNLEYATVARQTFLSSPQLAAALAAAALGLLCLSPSLALAADGQETAKEVSKAKAKGKFKVRLKLPGTDAPIDAPTPARVGEAMEWKVESDGQQHVFRIVLEPGDDAGKLSVKVGYQRGDAKVAVKTAEIDIASWASLETDSGDALGFFVSKKKHKKISISGGDNPLDGMD